MFCPAFLRLNAKRTGLLLLLSLGGSPAFAGSTLQSALDAYWQRHPQAQALIARESAARAGQARADGWLADAPSIALSRLDERDGAGRETELEIALPLARQRGERQQQANAQAEVIAAEARWLRLTLAAELLTVDSERRYRDEALQLSQQRLSVAQALARNVDAKVDAGELARTDALLASSEALAANAALLSAEQLADEARDAWQLRVGNLPGFDETLESALAPLPGDPQQHPQLQQALARAQAAAAEARFERRYSGDAELSLLMKREEDPLLDERVDSAGIRLSVPLFAGSQREQAAASADAARLSAEAEAQQLQRQLAQAQQQARRHYERSTQQRALAEQQLQLNQQSWQHAQAAFAAGELPLAELLRQQQRLFDSHESLSQAKQQLRSALARLLLAEGVLP